MQKLRCEERGVNDHCLEPGFLTRAVAVFRLSPEDTARKRRKVEESNVPH